MKTNKILISPVVCLLFASALTAQPAIAEPTDDGNLDILAALEALSDDPLCIPTGMVEGLNNASDALAVEGRHGSINISLPFGDVATPTDIGSGFIAFDNLNGSWSVPVTHVDGSLQIFNVISSVEAPTLYEYELSIPDGAVIKAIGDQIMVESRQGKLVGGIAPAWAVDSTGVAVETHFELVEGVLTQVVEHTSGDYVYPIVADPYLGTDLFYNFHLDLYQGDLRYNFSRTAWGVAVHAAPGLPGWVTGQFVMLNYGYDEVVDQWMSFTNKPTNRHQYDCHVLYGYAEVEWNIERIRSNNPDWLIQGPGHECNWT